MKRKEEKGVIGFNKTHVKNRAKKFIPRLKRNRRLLKWIGDPIKKVTKKERHLKDRKHFQINIANILTKKNGRTRKAATN